MQRSALTIASLIFLLIAAAHFIRFFIDVDLVIGNTALSLQTSIYAGVGAIIFAFWMYLAARQYGGRQHAFFCPHGSPSLFNKSRGSCQL